jgi:hypothetical protein
MFKRILKLATALLLLTQLTLSFNAQANESLDKLLQLIGVDNQLVSMPGAVKMALTQINQKGSKITQAQYQTLIRLVDKYILAADIKAHLKTQLSQKLTNQEVNALIGWYSSDVGKRLIAAETHASTPAAFGEMQQQAQPLLGDVNRVGFSKKMESIIGSTDMMVEMQISTTMAVYAGIRAITQAKSAITIDALRAQINGQKPAMKAQLEQLVLLISTYTWKDIGWADLAKYEQHLNTPASRKFIKAASDALVSGFDLSIAKWSEQVAQSVKAQPKPTENVK